VWISDVQASLKDALLILVGNKRDVDDEVRTRSQRQVTQQDAQAFKEKHRLHYHTEVSAKTGSGIKELVEHLAKSLYHIHQGNLSNFKEG
jgi:GTPase SAR1 family protein